MKNIFTNTRASTRLTDLACYFFEFARVYNIRRVFHHSFIRPSFLNAREPTILVVFRGVETKKTPKNTPKPEKTKNTESPPPRARKTIKTQVLSK